MVVMDNNRVRWGYTDDGGDTYAISAKDEYVSQVNGSSEAKQGGAVAAATVRRLPAEVKPRKVKMVSATGVVRWVVAYSVTADIWLTPGTTMNLDINGASVECSSTKYRRGEKARDTTTSTS